MKTQPSYVVGAALAALVLAGCATMPEINRVSADAAVDRSHFYYWLPKTRLVVELPITRTTRSIPGILETAQKTIGPKPTPIEYVDYLATKIEGFDRTTIPLATTRTYELVKKDITVASQGIEDPNARFDAGLQASWHDKMKLSMEFSSHGVMQKADVEVTNQTLPIVVTTVKTAATFAAMGLIETSAPDEDERPISPNTGWKKKVDDALWDLNHGKAVRKKMLRGKVTFADAAQMQLALGALERDEKDLTAALFGSSEEKTWIATCHFAPAPDQLSATVGKLHEAGGFEPQGEFVANRAVSPFAYKEKKTVADWRNPKSLNPDYDPARDDDGVRQWLDAPESVTIIEVTCVAIEPKPNTKLGTESLQAGSGSYAYRVPQKTQIEVQIRDGETTATPAVIKQAEVMVAQLGELRQLPRELGTFSGSYAITLDGETGALTNLTANADPGDISGAIEGIGGAVKTRQDAKKAKRDEAKAEAEANSPEAKREKERADLENQKAIRDLRAELGLTDSSGGQN